VFKKRKSAAIQRNEEEEGTSALGTKTIDVKGNHKKKEVQRKGVSASGPDANREKNHGYPSNFNPKSGQTRLWGGRVGRKTATIDKVKHKLISRNLLAAPN